MPSTFCRSAALRSFFVPVVSADTSHVMPEVWQVWMYGHAHHPYPSREEKEMLADVTDLTTVMCATPAVARACVDGELQRIRTGCNAPDGYIFVVANVRSRLAATPFF